MKYVIDIDGTICTNTNGDYKNAKPYLNRIEMINHLFEDGHDIIMFTARGMGSGNDNVELAKQKYYDFTENQLIEWGVKYSKLILGKPSGDIYIDDKGKHSNDFFREFYS